MNEAIAVWGRGLCYAALLTLAACGSDGSNSTDSGTPPSSQAPVTPPDPSDPSDPSDPTDPTTPTDPTDPEDTANTAPQILGKPRAQVQAGTRYAFQPRAEDADGDSLHFSIQGKPAWAAFDANTGRVQGMPSEADVGRYENIVISVSDGVTRETLPEFSIDVVAQGTATRSVTIAWTPPTRNTDGSPLTDLDGYRIHYGTESGNYDQTIDVNNAGVTRYVIESLAPGTYYFAISALSSTGVESNPSREAAETI